MNEHNFASYKVGTFATDISNLEFSDRFFSPKDMPAFIHEYCHYIQDTTTISAVFGFSLWLRDIVALTQVFSNGEDKTISIPLDKDEYGETINKYRKYYNLYCGEAKTISLDYTVNTFVKRYLNIEEVNLHGKKQILAVNEIELANTPNKMHFGLIVLQEIQAYYAQLLAEIKLSSTEFSVYAKNLPSFPYKFGDFLFEEFGINIDLQTKFILIDLCLDTMQAPTVFLDVLEKIKGCTVTHFGPNATDLVSTVEECRKKVAYSTDEALENIIPDLKTWSKGPGRKYLSEAIGWYVTKIELNFNLKKLTNPTFFSLAFCMDWPNFAKFFQCFPSPVYLNKGVLCRTTSIISESEDSEFLKNYEAATTIWSHRVLYDLLCSENLVQIKQKCQCPLYEGCHIRTQIGDDYTCKTAPWEIIKNEKKIICQYGMAAHSFGLWQNSLVIKD